ncbi:hypothetical protein HGRIS_005495 [Hohenbuehelia grisea]|uniref:Uncharacterized protein n=1 Tax=Hohenbuehelia grisea TaxID=104357 RepID=A0ABR3JZ90_9AGAR
MRATIRRCRRSTMGMTPMYLGVTLLSPTITAITTASNSAKTPAPSAGSRAIMLINITTQVGHRFQTNNGNGPFFAGPQTGYYTSSPVAEEEAGSPDTAAHQDSGRAVSRNQANALSPSNSNLEDTETTAGAYPLAMARNEPASPRRRAGANGTKKTLGRAPSDPHGTQGNGTSR